VYIQQTLLNYGFCYGAVQGTLLYLQKYKYSCVDALHSVETRTQVHVRRSGLQEYCSFSAGNAMSRYSLSGHFNPGEQSA